MPLEYFRRYGIDGPNVFSALFRAALTFNAPMGIGVRHGVVNRNFLSAVDILECNQGFRAHDSGVWIARMIDIPERRSLRSDPGKSSQTYPMCDLFRVFLISCFHHCAFAAYVLDALGSFDVFGGKNASAVNFAF